MAVMTEELSFTEIECEDCGWFLEDWEITKAEGKHLCSICNYPS